MALDEMRGGRLFRKADLSGASAIPYVILADPVTGSAPAAGAVPSFGASLQPSTRATYAGSITFNPAATPTDMLALEGSASKVIRLLQARITGYATTAGQLNALFMRRSALNTGGTSTTVTAAKLDSADAAPTAVMRAYTVNPAGLGASAGGIARVQPFLALATAQSQELVLDWTADYSKAPVLRGAAEAFTLNHVNAVPASTVLAVSLLWTEE